MTLLITEIFELYNNSNLPESISYGLFVKKQRELIEGKKSYYEEFWNKGK